MTLLLPEAASYLEQLLLPSDAVGKELEDRAKEQFIPIMDPDTASLVKVLGLAHCPQIILEVGTAIGYSAYIMATHTQAKIVTIELNEDRYLEAVELFQRTGLTDRILPILGDALTVLPELEQHLPSTWAATCKDAAGRCQFDWILLDAAKGQYPHFLELLLPRLKPQGLLFSDNILFQGLVSGPEFVKHKLRTLVNRLREYNQLLASHPLLETSFVPVGDGLAISTFKKTGSPLQDIQHP